MFSFGNKTTPTPGMSTMFSSTTTQSAPTFGFGSTIQTSTPSFGGPVVSSTASAPGFSASTSFPQATGFGFTGPTATAAAAPGASFSFGQPATTSSGFAFGTSTTSAPQTGVSLGSGLGLGSTLANTTATSLPGFGALAAPAPILGSAPTLGSVPTLGLGVATTTTASGFGTTPLTGFSLGGPSNVSTAAPSFSFSTPAPATTSGASGLGAGLNFPTSLSSGGLNFSSGTTAATTTSAPVNFGLGGQATTTSLTTPKSETTSSTSATQKETNPKEQPLPNEILQTVESFKQHIKQQKIYSSDIARCSVKDFERVKNDIDSFNKILIGLERELQMNRCLAEKLKYDTAKALQHVEMAQRTQETPPGLQYENTAPMQYFNELVDTFEREIQALKIQVENTDKYIKNFGQPASLTSQDLTMGMRRLHETFVALAGRLQSVHSQVESQKELYLNIRKHVFNDNMNPFENRDNTQLVVVSASGYTPPKVGSGPTPFNNSHVTSMTLTTLQSQPPPAYPSTGTTSFMGGGFSSSGFGTSTSQNNPLLNTSLNTSTSFQLQKPPTGVKRGKQ